MWLGLLLLKIERKLLETLFSCQSNKEESLQRGLQCKSNLKSRMKVLSLLVLDHVNPLILIPRVNSTLFINTLNLLLMLVSKTLRSANDRAAFFWIFKLFWVELIAFLLEHLAFHLSFWWKKIWKSRYFSSKNNRNLLQLEIYLWSSVE